MGSGRVAGSHATGPRTLWHMQHMTHTEPGLAQTASVCVTHGTRLSTDGMYSTSDICVLLRAVFYFISSFPFLFAFAVGVEFCVFVAGWRHALRSEWPFIITGTVIYYVIITEIPYAIILIFKKNVRCIRCVVPPLKNAHCIVLYV